MCTVRVLFRARTQDVCLYCKHKTTTQTIILFHEFGARSFDLVALGICMVDNGIRVLCKYGEICFPGADNIWARYNTSSDVSTIIAFDAAPSNGARSNANKMPTFIETSHSSDLSTILAMGDIEHQWRPNWGTECSSPMFSSNSIFLFNCSCCNWVSFPFRR